MDLTTKSLISYFSDDYAWENIQTFCRREFVGAADEGDNEIFIEALSRSIAKHLSKSRPRKKSKKSRIRPPISFGPSDIL